MAHFISAVILLRCISCRVEKGAMAGAQGVLGLSGDEESLSDLPVCLEAKHCEEAAQRAQTGPVLIFYCSSQRPILAVVAVFVVMSFE